MSSGPVNLTLGTISNGATAIIADVSSLAPGLEGGHGPGDVVRVTLTTAYAMACPASFPVRPFDTGAQPPCGYPRTLTSGLTLAFLRLEADALVNAGAATYA
jgi:hypothetical protein